MQGVDLEAIAAEQGIDLNQLLQSSPEELQEILDSTGYAIDLESLSKLAQMSPDDLESMLQEASAEDIIGLLESQNIELDQLATMLGFDAENMSEDEIAKLV